MYLTRHFLANEDVTGCSVHKISVLDNQAEFQTLTLFYSRYFGVPRRNTNMAAPYKALLILQKLYFATTDTFTKKLKSNNFA